MSNSELTRRNLGQFALYQNNQPLYDRVPTQDENGKPYADFMILIPQLNKASLPQLKAKMARLQAVLVNYSEVVFVDLNLKLNVLWVSLRPKVGLIEQISLEIQACLPEAKLISGEFRDRKY